MNSIKVVNSNKKFGENQLSTHWSQSDIDLARGLDFYRTEARNGGPVLATFTHLNYDLFNYEIQVSSAILVASSLKVISIFHFYEID